MTAKEIYEAESASFNNKYGIEFSVENYQTFRSKTRYMDNFTFEVDQKNEPFNAYVDTLSKALKIHMEKLTKMEDRKIYDTSDVSIGKFIIDFERLMSKKYLADLKEGEPPRRGAFEGEEFSKVAKAAWERVKPFNKHISEVWADSIVKKNFSVDQMKALTATATTNLAGVRSKSNLSPNTRKDLGNIVMAQKAMEKLREKRGRLWRITHLWQNSKEKSYLKDLTNQVNSFRRMELPVEDIISENAKAVLSDAGKKLRADIKTNGRALNNSMGARNAAATATVTDAKQADLLFADKELTAKMKGQIGEMIGKVSKNEVLNDMVRDMTHDTIVKDIKTMWTNFEKNKGFDREKHLQNSANGIFLNTYLKLSMIQPEPKDRIVMAQKITDLMLKQYSPAASDQKYEKYGDNYYIKNTDPASIKNVMGLKENADEVIAEAKLDLGVDKKVQIDISNDVNQKESQKSSMVESIEAPSLQQVKNG